MYHTLPHHIDDDITYVGKHIYLHTFSRPIFLLHIRHYFHHDYYRYVCVKSNNSKLTTTFLSNILIFIFFLKLSTCVYVYDYVKKAGV